MAVEIVIAVPAKGDLTFDFTNEVITAENTIDTLTAQELANAIRDAEDELLASTFDIIATMAGKTDLGSSVFTGIVIELLGWKLVSGKSSGTFIVQDGTVIATSLGGNIFDVNNSVSQINLMTQSASIVSSGSGVTAGDKTDIADTILNRNLAGGSTGGRTVKDALRANRNKVALSGTDLTVYEEDDTTEAWTAVVTKGSRDPINTVDPA